MGLYATEGKIIIMILICIIQSLSFAPSAVMPVVNSLLSVLIFCIPFSGPDCVDSVFNECV